MTIIMTNEVLNIIYLLILVFQVLKEKARVGSLCQDQSIVIHPMGVLGLYITDVQCTTGHNLKMWESDVGAREITKSCVLEEFYTGP